MITLQVSIFHAYTVNLASRPASRSVHIHINSATSQKTPSPDSLPRFNSHTRNLTVSDICHFIWYGSWSGVLRLQADRAAAVLGGFSFSGFACNHVLHRSARPSGVSLSMRPFPGDETPAKSIAGSFSRGHTWSRGRMLSASAAFAMVVSRCLFSGGCWILH